MNDGVLIVWDDKVEDEFYFFEDVWEDESLRVVEKDFATTFDDESGWYMYWYVFFISLMFLFCVVCI